MRHPLMALALGVLTLAACSDGTGSSFDDFVGSYHAEANEAYAATEFVLTVEGEAQDLLAIGGVVDLTLNENGTTDGRIFVPGAGEEGGDFDESLAGTWTVEGDAVHLDHEGDTFLRDIPLHLDGNLLEGEFTSGPASVRIALQRD